MAVITIARFRSAGADEDFLAADRRAQTEFFYRQPGLVRRTTARSAEGEWLVVTVWQSAADAEAADQRRDDDPAAKTFDRLIDQPSLRTGRYETLD